jgi:hypothetical protein
MLWTLGSAVCLAAGRWSSNPPPDEGGPLDTFLAVHSFLYALPHGALLASVALWGYRRWRGVGGFPTQPGHWLLLVEGVGLILSLVGYAATLGLAMLVPAFEVGGGAWWLAYIAPSALTGLVGYALAWPAMRGESRLWKLAIGFALASHAFATATIATIISFSLFNELRGGVSPMSFTSGLLAPQNCTWLNLLYGLFVLAAGCGDAVGGKPRDFLHWTGVVAVLTVALLQAAMPIVVWQVLGSG